LRRSVTLVTLTKFVALTARGRLVLLEAVRYPISHWPRTHDVQDSLRKRNLYRWSGVWPSGVQWIYRWVCNE